MTKRFKLIVGGREILTDDWAEDLVQESRWCGAAVFAIFDNATGERIGGGDGSDESLARWDNKLRSAASRTLQIGV